MPRKLKVYRTPIGFHDAYVAAPSQKAALDAWGADANLFARGVAEEVTDPVLMEEPLASPGQVIRKARGTMAEHLAALPPTPEPTARKQPVDEPPSVRKSSISKPRAAPKPKPRPSRDQLHAAETALEDAERQQAEAKRYLMEREAALARERQELERNHGRDVERLERTRAVAEREYRRAVASWQEQ